MPVCKRRVNNQVDRQRPSVDKPKEAEKASKVAAKARAGVTMTAVPEGSCQPRPHRNRAGENQGPSPGSQGPHYLGSLWAHSHLPTQAPSYSLPASWPNDPQ